MSCDEDFIKHELRNDVSVDGIELELTRALLRLGRTMNLIQGEGGREGREGGREGGMTVICMFNSNPIIPQYLNNNLT